MNSDIGAAVHQIALALLELRKIVPKLDERVGRLEHAIQQLSGLTGGGGSSSQPAYWIKSPGFAAATGSFPSLTPSVQTGVTVYYDLSGTMTSYLSGQTVRWWYKDAATAGKLMKVERSGDGTDWNGVLDSCTGV